MLISFSCANILVGGSVPHILFSSVPFLWHRLPDGNCHEVRANGSVDSSSTDELGFTGSGLSVW